MPHVLTCVSAAEGFPHTENAANLAVAKFRLQIAERSGEVADCWSIDDHLVALSHRLGPLQMFGIDVFNAAVHAFRVLWPEDKSEMTPKILAERLMGSGLRLDEWRESSARAGADEALSVILSWYETLDFDLFQSLRTNGKFVSEPEWIEKRKQLANSFIEYIDLDKLIDGPSFDQQRDEPAEEADGESGEDDEETEDDEEAEEVEKIEETGEDAAKPLEEGEISEDPAAAARTEAGGPFPLPSNDPSPDTQIPLPSVAASAAPRDLGKAPVVHE